MGVVAMDNPAMGVTAYIGLGSNLDDPCTQVRRALDALVMLPASRLLAHSGLYRSRPLGGMAQPDYINAVAALETRLDAGELLTALQAIEQAQGRVRDGTRWAARTLDLDLLLYGEQRIANAVLTVPHPEIARRAFVLHPLQEIAVRLGTPDIIPLDAWLAACPADDLQRLEDA